MSKRKKQPEFVARLEAIRESGARFTFKPDPRLDIGNRREGYLLAYSSDYLVIHEFCDFRPEGYTIWPVTAISDISVYEEDFFHKVCEAEHLLSGLTPSWKLDLSSIRNAIADVHRYHRYLKIYEEFTANEFFNSFGRVVHFGEDSLLFQKFDADGEWEDELIRIWYEEIREVEFDTPYINMFTKYLSEPPEPDFSQYDLEELGS